MDKLTEILKITPSERNRLIRWYAKMNEVERVDVHSQQTYLLRTQREIFRKNLSHDETAYAALCLALWRREHTLDSLSKKSELTEEQAKRISGMRIDSIKGSRRHKEGEIEKAIRIKWFPEIKKLRYEGLSWREISDYIAKYHKKRVSHTYLANTYKKIEEIKKQQGDNLNEKN